MGSGLDGAVVNATDCYPKGAGFGSRVIHEIFPQVKEVEDTGLTNQPGKRTETCILKIHFEFNMQKMN
jgi:hypothetical protein